MKVVINTLYGGFSLSHEGVLAYAARKGITLYPEKNEVFGYWDYWTVPKKDRLPDVSGEKWHVMTFEERKAYNEQYKREHLDNREIPRDDPDLVAVVEELGAKADGFCAELKVVEIPDGVEWQIEEYDGKEWVAEKHRTWG